MAHSATCQTTYHCTGKKVPCSSHLLCFWKSRYTSWEGISTVLMIMDSSDPAIQDNQPDVNTGKKWKTEEETDRTISALRHQYIVGAVQMDRKGIGSGSLSLKQRGENRSDGKRQRKLKLEWNLELENVTLELSCVIYIRCSTTSN